MAAIETKVIDNWLEPHLADYLSEYLYNQIDYRPGHGSKKGDNTSFLFGTVPYTPLIDFIFYKIKRIKPVSLLRVYTNLHYSHMGGDFHLDDGDITFLYMPSKNLNTNEGHFEIKDEQKFEYKFNRLIYFDATKLHKGHAPTTGSRITLAFKTKSLI